tara:strand:- start:234 stop:512 length:279 start_codon:yes stop_codon:yes gene_type:complete
MPGNAETRNKLYVQKLGPDTWQEVYTVACDASELLDTAEVAAHPLLTGEMTRLVEACFEATRGNSGPYSAGEYETFKRLQFLVAALLHGDAK